MLKFGMCFFCFFSKHRRWLIRGEFGESLELQDFPFDTQVRAPTRATQAKQLFCSLSQTISKEASNY